MQLSKITKLFNEKYENRKELSIKEIENFIDSHIYCGENIDSMFSHKNVELFSDMAISNSYVNGKIDFSLLDSSCENIYKSFKDASSDIKIYLSLKEKEMDALFYLVLNRMYFEKILHNIECKYIEEKRKANCIVFSNMIVFVS